MRFHSSLLSLLVLFSAPAGAKPQYTIHEATAAGGSLEVSLELPASGTWPLRLVARSLQTTQPDQIGDVRCDGTLLEKDGAGWVLPRRCHTASWTVSLVRTSDIQASEQRSIWLDSGWGIVTEPSAILRLKGSDGEAALRFVRPGMTDTEAVLSSPDSAPGIYLIGDPPTRAASFGTRALVYAGDDLPEVSRQIDPAAHLVGLGYLREVVGDRQLRDLPVLTVIWLAVGRSEGSVGGAAGHDAVLVNYIRPDADSTPVEALMPLVIVIHEQFHQLVKGKLPLWAAESLAQFYGLKTLTRIEVDQAAAASLREREFAAGPDGPGLAEVQEQVRQGDASNYDMFYGKGVAFWNRVDLTIQSESGGTRSLDDIMPALLGTEFNPDGSLPDTVLAEVPLSTRGKIRAIEREFL